MHLLFRANCIYLLAKKTVLYKKCSIFSEVDTLSIQRIKGKQSVKDNLAKENINTYQSNDAVY